MSNVSLALLVNGGRVVHRLIAQARLVGRLCAGGLVGHSVVLATVIASPPAAAQPSAGASNVRGAHATQGSNKVDLFTRRVFANRDVDDIQNVTPKQQLRKHHIGIQLGILNPSTDVIELGNLDLGIEGNAGLVILGYRYSLNPFIDLALELGYWGDRWSTSASREVKLAAGFIGPGIRVNGLNRTKGKRLIPYLQANIYYVQEQLTSFETLTEDGIGFGLSGGVALHVSGLISMPIEATYVGSGGNDIDDLSGFGLSVGVNFNF
jgi:hypothetical protein